MGGLVLGLFVTDRLARDRRFVRQVFPGMRDGITLTRQRVPYINVAAVIPHNQPTPVF